MSRAGTDITSQLFEYFVNLPGRARRSAVLRIPWSACSAASSSAVLGHPGRIAGGFSGVDGASIGELLADMGGCFTRLGRVAMTYQCVGLVYRDHERRHAR